jgi:hypothetical protein
MYLGAHSTTIEERIMCRINRRQFLQLLAASAAFVSISDKSETEYKTDNSKEKEMDSKTLVTYCGLYCDLCSDRTKIPERARALMEELKKADYEDWGPDILEGFTEFWSLLRKLTVVEDDRCCRTGKCGSPSCAIRKCAIGKGIYVCPECQDYPCAKIKTLGKSEPTLVHDGEKIKEHGLDAWIIEQKERKRVGFCYSDIRYGPCEVPTD